MRHVSPFLLDELLALLPALGKDGGVLSASFYDTAQVVRHSPDAARTDETLEWLLAHQGDDGGWGDPSVPLCRTAPTLAVLLALREHDAGHDAATRGIDFLASQGTLWSQPLPEDVPIGAELILPRLLEQAQDGGLHVDPAPYTALMELGAKRRALIARLQPGAATTPMHSWEAWGSEPASKFLDAAGSIGHSPAATAAWLKAAPKDPAAVALAQEYLCRASAATGTGVWGIMPTVYPIDRFEKLWAPYALMLTANLDAPQLANVIAPLLDDIGTQLNETKGLGFSDAFTPDGDDTAAGLACLLAGGRPADLSLLARFEEGEHFCTWRHEMNVSLSTTTRAVHALSLAGHDVKRHRDYLVRRQEMDGRWQEDKWHRSWLYTTCHAMAALAPSEDAAHHRAVEKALDAVLNAQHAAGCWATTGPHACATETAYAVLTLMAAGNTYATTEQVERALQGAEHWLRENLPAWERAGSANWIGKEAYRPYRVDRAFELIALAALESRAANRALSC